ncbi:MAG: PadR family transcriptional regulator [Nitrososphaerales archaeon]
MTLKSEDIVSLWRKQIQKGYLKLAVLFALTKGPLHGYKMMESIKELTLGIITPTAGGLYPALKELEKEGIIKGEWKTGERKKVYKITDKGKDVFKKAVEKHFELISLTRSWILKEISKLKIIEGLNQPSEMIPAIKVLLLDEKASIKDRIEALESLKADFQGLINLFNEMIKHIDNRINELRFNAL